MTLLSSCLTSENHRAVIDAARHKSKRDVELQAALRPAPDAPSMIRKLPAKKPSAAVAFAPPSRERMDRARLPLRALRVPASKDRWARRARFSRRPGPP